MAKASKSKKYTTSWPAMPEVHAARVSLYSSGAAGAHLQPVERPRRSRNRAAIAESRAAASDR